MNNISTYLILNGATIKDNYMHFELSKSKYVINIPSNYDDKTTLAYLGFLTFHKSNKLPFAIRTEIGVLTTDIIFLLKNTLFL